MNKGEIWLAELPTANGHEQAGIRPVAMVTETEANIAIIIPFTSNLQALRFPHTIEVKPSGKNGLSEISVALLFQIRAIDKRRLKKKVGQLENQTLEEMNTMMKKMLQI